MKRQYTLEQVPNPLLVLRRAGYSPFRDPNTGEDSFILRLTSEFYPRFHLYVEDTPGGVSFNLHLDQKKPSYGQNHAHAGEYDGTAVEREMERIDSWIQSVDEEIAHPHGTVKEEQDYADGLIHGKYEHPKRKLDKKTSRWKKFFFGA